MNQAQDLLDRVARRHIPDDADLYPALLARVQRQINRRRRRQRVLALVVLALALSAAAYVVGRSLGYLPGVGVINSEESLRLLAAPVSQTRQGLTLEITQGAADTKQTVLTYRVTNDAGTFPPPTPPAEDARPWCTDTSYLRLPLGLPLPLRHGIGANSNGRWIFPPLPKGISKVELVVPCVTGLGLNTHADWHLTLRFVPASGELTLIPVDDVPVPTFTPPSPGAPATAPGAAPPITVHAMRLQDTYVLFGDISQNFVTLENIVVTDARGQRVPLLPPPDDMGLSDYRWQVAFAADNVRFPVDLAFRWVVEGFEKAESPVILTVPLNDDPFPGQVWRPEHTFTVGSHTLTLQSIQAVGDKGYTFVFTAPVEVLDVHFTVEEARPVASSGTMASDTTPIRRTLIFARRPTGTLHLKITGVMVQQSEQEIHVPWTPEETPTAEATSQGKNDPASTVCLTKSRWQQLLDNPPELPYLPGKMVCFLYQQGSLLPALFVVRPDGSTLQKVGHGAWPALSPTGNWLLYSASDGWKLLNLNTHEYRALPGDGRHPIWSPDEQQVLFAQGLGLYVLSLPEGTQTLITQGSGGPVEPVRWSQDGRNVLYTALENGAFHLRQRDLRAGTRTDLGLSFNNKAGFAALSPDGAWLAFADLQGTGWGLYLAHPDGTQRRQLVASNVPITFMVSWSPDSQWIAINTSQDGQENTQALVINPFTCEVYPLPWEGTVEGWAP